MLAVAVATAVFGSSWESEGRGADKQMTTWVNLGNLQILCAGNEEEHVVKWSDSTDRESSIHQTFEEKLWSANQFFSKLWFKKEKSVFFRSSWIISFIQTGMLFTILFIMRCRFEWMRVKNCTESGKFHLFSQMIDCTDFAFSDQLVLPGLILIFTSVVPVAVAYYDWKHKTQQHRKHIVSAATPEQSTV